MCYNIYNIILPFSFHRKPRNRHRNRGFALEEMDIISADEFKSMFRIDRLTFDEIQEMIDPILKKNEIMAIKSSGSVISTRTKLAVSYI